MCAQHHARLLSNSILLERFEVDLSGVVGTKIMEKAPEAGKLTKGFKWVRNFACRVWTLHANFEGIIKDSRARFCPGRSACKDSGDCSYPFRGQQG